MTRPLTPEDFIYGFEPAGDPHITPDGSAIIYTMTRTDADSGKAASNIWRCGIDGSGAHPITHAKPGVRNSGARWSPDGSNIAFTSNRSGKPGIYVMSIDGGEARELTTHARAIFDLAWSPDGTLLTYTTTYDPENPDDEERPDDAPPPVRVTRRLDYKQDNRGYLNDVRFQVWVVDVASGERRMITRTPVDHNHPQWSPDGQTLAVKIPNRNGMCSQLGLVSVATGSTILIGPEDGMVGVWSWSPDGTRMLFSGDTSQTWQPDWFLYDVDKGQVNRLTDDLPVLPDPGFPTITPPSQPVWLDDRKALVHAIRAGSSGLYEVDTKNGNTKLVHDWRGSASGLSMDDGHRYAVQGLATMESIGEIAVFDRKTGTDTVITDQNGALLTEAPPARWERFDVKRSDYTTEAWLLMPPDFDPTRRYPVILDVHGGPNGFYGYSFNAVQQVLATNGFIVVYSNPRGSGSYGRDFTQQVIRDWGGEDYQDLMAVLDTVLERPYADEHRTGIFGYSYGGYMTAWAISQTDRFGAAVCGAPCFDLESMYGTSDIGHIFGEIQWGGQPYELPDWYAAHSPSTFAHRTTTPTLIVHGEADDRCPIGQGEQMFVALKKAGCEAEFVRYPGGSHLMLRGGPPEHRVDFYRRVLGWFEDHLTSSAA
jgi:dipeptidyl aminopeptidase/acylaminoacyl peptidase